MVKPEYRHLFYMTETGVAYIRAEFEAGGSDEEKMGIFFYHEVKWEGIREEVREFTHANWARWKEEQPAWFTEEMVQCVPDEFVPIAALAELNAANGGKRRRSSVGLVESVRRESVRKKEEGGRKKEEVGAGVGVLVA
jgi:hypothetical protein